MDNAIKLERGSLVKFLEDENFYSVFEQDIDKGLYDIIDIKNKTCHTYNLNKKAFDNKFHKTIEKYSMLIKEVGIYVYLLGLDYYYKIYLHDEEVNHIYLTSVDNSLQPKPNYKQHIIVYDYTTGVFYYDDDIMNDRTDKLNICKYIWQAFSNKGNTNV